MWGTLQAGALHKIQGLLWNSEKMFGKRLEMRNNARYSLLFKLFVPRLRRQDHGYVYIPWNFNETHSLLPRFIIFDRSNLSTAGDPTFGY